MQSRPDFDVEPVSIHYARAVGNNQQSADTQKGHYTNVAQEAIHFWRNDRG